MTRKHDKIKKHKDSEAEQAQAEEPEVAMEQVLKEKEEILGQLQRVSADYANFQKRVPKQIADSVAYQKERLITSLLPVLDNLEHTLANVGSAQSVDVLVKGIEIIYDQMLDILKSHQVEQIAAAGEMFDPSKHEAMMHRSEPDRQDNIVLEQLQKGYVLNGRVLRPSRVIINKQASQAPRAACAEPADGDEIEQAGGADEGTEQCDGE
ncbi:MAG TPA: nucleotide exchange factor GrpE [Sedimentisphaerales bacterium]|nr:nucleotide exchange factor GrpE [Sedimentisphaerales bacterium]